MSEIRRFDDNTTVMRKMIKHRFPSVIIDGKYYSLDYQDRVLERYYYKYSDERNVGLSQNELDYNQRLDQSIAEYTDKYEQEICELKIRLVEILEENNKLKGSVWEYLKVKFS